MLNLKEKYQKQAIPAMLKEPDYKNVMALPKIEKVILNIGFGKTLSGKGSGETKKIQASIKQQLMTIAGQQPVLTKAKKSIAGFKIRKGLTVGAKITLRGPKMYDFLDRLIHFTLPRSRDFQGLNQKSVDRGGNLTIGIKEHISFPEILPEKARQILGFEITVVTTAKTKEQGLKLLRLLGFPIKSE